jgi:phosphoserine phosphatase RsbU/P
MSKGNNPKFDLKVLYCEDAANTVVSLSKILKYRFEQVVIAQDGAIGWQKYCSEKFDLIITDIRMPNLSGLDMVKKIREFDSNIRIIIISAHTDIDYFMQAIDLGINAFIKKPVDFNIMNRQLEKISHEILMEIKLKKEEIARIALQTERDKIYHEIKQDLSLARTVQEYILPEWLLFTDKIIFSTAYSPSFDVGGDLFGYLEISPGKFVFFLGDVAGHGIKSAMLMMAVYSSINMLIEQEKHDLSPAVIASKLNKSISNRIFLHNNYMTLILGTIDLNDSIVRYIRFGHPEIIVFDHLTNEAVLVQNPKGAIPVGWIPDYQYSPEEEEILELKDNQSVFLYSDGLFECALPDGTRLGQTDLLKEMNKAIPDMHPLTATLEFMEYLKNIGYNISQDDFSLMSFFIPNAIILPNLKDHLRIVVPQNIHVSGDSTCYHFLLKCTQNHDFAQTFQSDINVLFRDDVFIRQNRFISPFLLLLVYDDGSAICHCWLKSIKKYYLNNDTASSTYLLDQKVITAYIQSHNLYKKKYLHNISFKILGDFLQISCQLNPNIPPD